jgi:hypothetical protein
LIDFTKIELKGANISYFEQHPLLDFEIRINSKTGELLNVSNAYYYGLEFKIYDITEKTPYKRLTIEGSLHKYWNKGAHNFNDFGINEIKQVRLSLFKLFNIDFKNCVLRQLEIGVNITPPDTSTRIIRNCLLHKVTELKSIYTKDEGTYKQARNQRHYFKIYDKRKHYVNRGFKIDSDILRIEKKYCKMIELNSKGIITLYDLLDYGLINFKNILLDLWQNVLFYDYTALNHSTKALQYSNTNYWMNLCESNYELFKYHRKKMNVLIRKNPNNLKNKIAVEVRKKIVFLNAETTEINPLYIRLKTGVKNNINNEANRRFCLHTGLNISMQKRNSFLLSHTGIRYYKKSDRKIFEQLKRTYLSQIWLQESEEIQIKELAHNIRNRYYNSKRKHCNQNHSSQYLLFNNLETGLNGHQ